MEKMKMESVDLISKNVEKIAELFPECVTESADNDGNLRLLVNFDKLRQVLSGDVVEEPERYDFTWVGKRAALAEAHTPIRKTLRPCPEESRDWDATQNLYIEGDNLDVLKLLQESYLGKVKMIYIDPPYNTGSDSFVYPDNYRADDDEYEAQGKMRDECGNKKFRENNETNPRFHSDWCSMIYSRLILARNLLTPDGVIFISIDDNEVSNMKQICSEVFGDRNELGTLIWNKQHSQQQGIFKRYHESVLVYAKESSNIHNISCGTGIIEAGALKKISRSNPEREFTFPAGTRFDAPDGTKFVGTFGDAERVTVVRGAMEAFQGKLLHEVTLSAGWTQKNQMSAFFRGDEVFDSKGQRVKEFFFNSTGKIKCTKERSSITPPSLLPLYGMVSEQSEKLKQLLGVSVFSSPKPVNMIRDFVLWFTKDDDIVLDFFSGSATTAHSVMQLNAEDGGNRHFIMVQLPEKCDTESESTNAGYSNICEIGKERIRRAGDKIKAENALTTKDLDIGFRVLKVDSTNMNDVYYGASEVSQDLIKSTESNVKDDRTDLDLLFGCLLDWGLPLSCPYKSEEIDGVTIHDYNDGDLIACFAENVPKKVFEKVVETIAKRKPIRAVFRDSCFADDAVKINVTELFKRYSPDARIKTI